MNGIRNLKKSSNQARQSRNVTAATLKWYAKLNICFGRNRAIELIQSTRFCIRPKTIILVAGEGGAQGVKND